MITRDKLSIIKQILASTSVGKVSDGSHTFDELYYHRMVLFSLICDLNKERAWKSKEHHPRDSDMFKDYFIVGIDTPEGQYSYHYAIEYWDIFKVRELPHAPKWDNHNPEDVNRLRSLLNVSTKRSPWTEDQIEESEFYGVSLYNSATSVPMVWEVCERCKNEFHREATNEYFPRYCPECLTIEPRLKENELIQKQNIMRIKEVHSHSSVPVVLDEGLRLDSSAIMADITVLCSDTNVMRQIFFFSSKQSWNTTLKNGYIG